MVVDFFFSTTTTAPCKIDFVFFFMLDFVEFEYAQDALTQVARLSARFPQHAVVLDIDDTVLYTNQRSVRQIPSLHLLYADLRKHNTPIFFVTARKFSLANLRLTARHLRGTGYPYFRGLFLRPADVVDVAKFKTFVRNWLRQEKKQTIGFVVGNTWHDLFSHQELVQFSNTLKHLDDTKTYLFFALNSFKLKLPTTYSPQVYQRPKSFFGL